jgi:hydroxypyruvate isomerase
VPQYDLFHMQMMEGNLAATSSGCSRGSATSSSPTPAAEPGPGEINFDFLLAHLTIWLLGLDRLRIQSAR